MIKSSPFTTIFALFSMGCTAAPSAKTDTADIIIEPTSVPPADLECIPGGSFKSVVGQPVTGREYAAMCEPHVGIPPEFDCNEGVLIPVTVNGQPDWTHRDFYDCDENSLQLGQCVPGSTIQRFSGRTAEGEELPEVVWVGFCRTQFSVNDGNESTYENGIQIIGYNYETGATCMFNNRTSFGFHDGTTHTEEAWKAKGEVPSVDNPRFDEVMGIPILPQCTLCHRSSPFVHNSWIDQARLPENPDEPVLPTINDPNQPFWVIGASDWDMRTVHIDDNGCVRCHRANMGLSELYVTHRWDPNEHMPPLDPGSMAADYQALLNCWENGPENTSKCDWVIPPGGGCEGGSVGDDYPFKLPFELPNENPEDY